MRVLVSLHERVYIEKDKGTVNVGTKLECFFTRKGMKVPHVQFKLHYPN